MIPTLAVSAFNHLLSQQPWLATTLAPFAGKTVAMQVPPLTIHALIQSDGFLYARAAGGEADATLRFPPGDWLKLLGDAATRRGAVRVEGDGDLAAALGDVLSALSWDVAEDLSKVIGDAAASQVVSVVEKTWAEQREVAQSFAGQVADYLVDEAGVIADRHAVADFVEQVDHLRDDTARLEARIALLEDRLHRGPAA